MKVGKNRLNAKHVVQIRFAVFEKNAKKTHFNSKKKPSSRKLGYTNNHLTG